MGVMERRVERGHDFVQAYVNHGRWVADCECGGAEIVDPARPTFFCVSCGNAGHGGQSRAVEFPDYVAGIEIILAVRPIINRNWLVGESLLDLARENKAHGLGMRES